MTIWSALDTTSVLVDATAGGVSLTLPSGNVIYASFQVLDVNRDLVLNAPIRVNEDPDETVTAAGAEGSVLFPVGSLFEVWGKDALTAFRAIRTTSNSAYLAVTFFGTAV